MGMLRNLAVAGIAKKAYDLARKPENQAKIKQLIAQMGEQNKKRGGGAGRGRGPVR
ncbi:hypothetical protein [Blastococcus sp. SYSU D00820]